MALKREQLGSDHHENQATGKEGRLIADITSTDLRKEKWLYTSRLFRVNSLKKGAKLYVVSHYYVTAQ
jgi:hypothetical protein